MNDESQRYSATRFRVDLVDRLNYARMASKKDVLRVDPELDEWVQKPATGARFAMMLAAARRHGRRKSQAAAAAAAA